MFLASSACLFYRLAYAWRGLAGTNLDGNIRQEEASGTDNNMVGGVKRKEASRKCNEGKKKLEKK